jgi:NAD(P)H-dependent flavin oxidoreductase YrpB (nitropropane dioxygenase family)
MKILSLIAMLLDKFIKAGQDFLECKFPIMCGAMTWVSDYKLIDKQQAQYEVENFWMGALRDAAINGNIERGSLMAGQSVGLVNKIKPIQGIIDEMVSDAESELKRLNKIFMETDCGPGCVPNHQITTM